MVTKKDDQAFRDAEEAERLLNEPILKRAWESYEHEIVEQWVKSNPTDRDGHHELLHMLRASRSLRVNLIRFVKTGKLAEYNLKGVRK